MPKQSQKAEVNSFIGGLITESSPLNFPTHASADELNFELKRDGSRHRRLGMDFEPGYALVDSGLTPTDLATAGYSSFKWLSAGGITTANFVVFQIADRLYFFNADLGAISSGYRGYLELTQFPSEVVFSMDSVNGMLVVVSGSENVAVVTYDGANFTLTYERLQTRDLWGVEETIDPKYEADVSYRGGDNTQHRYNLHNQSWGIPRKNAQGVKVDPAGYYNQELSKFPSNSEQVWAGLQMQAVAANQQPYERMFTNLYDEVLGSNSVAAKGYFIIDLLNRGQGRQDAIAANNAKYPETAFSYAPPRDFTPGGPSCIAEFAGRMFYGGFGGQVLGGDARSPNLGNYVFFSKLVKSSPDINKCYQEGDPSSRDSSDVVDTDGGFVRIAGAQNILAMRAMGIYLVVIAENGIWGITGGTQSSGFSATSYKVDKLSAFGAVAPQSVVVDGDTCYYWANDGIYIISKNQFGDLGVNNMTIQTIQTLYQNIPNLAKQKAFGGYDQINKKVRWLYKTGTLFDVSSNTMELVYDAALQNFTQNRIFNSTTNNAEVAGVFQSQLFIQDVSENDVYVATDPVFVSSDPVQVTSNGLLSTKQYLRYFTFKKDNNVVYITVSYYNQPQWLDWKSADNVGTDAAAYCLTGAVTGGDSSLDKQIPYLTMHFVRTENAVDSNLVPTNQSSCLIRSQWNFANAIQSNKWSPLVQAYRYRKVRFSEDISDTYDTGFAIIATKNKLRGKGKAFALYFQTEPGKDCQILGWNVAVNANQIT